MINSCRLDNGLTLVHLEDNTTQMVATNVLYRVGSADEDPNHTGLAHLLEHLMFGGSENAPLFDPPLENACGENNAFTNNDYTDYYITLPAAYIETALFLESDRMTRLVLTPHTLEVQRKVVMEEFKLHYINQPYGDMAHLLADLIFPEGPYHWPTIGLKLSHIEEVDLSTVQDFYHRFYAPSNAILTIVGNISWERTQSLAHKWFGQLPSPRYGALPPSGGSWRGALTLPPSGGSRRGAVHRPVPNDVLVAAWLAPSAFDGRLRAFDLVSDLLATGKSSRLYHTLIDRRQLALSVDAYILPRLGQSNLFIEIIPAEGVSTQTVEEALHEEMDRLLAQPVPRRELEKVKNRFETNLAAQRDNCQNIAQQIAWYTFLGDPQLYYTDLQHYRALTPATLLRDVADDLSWDRVRLLHYLSEE